MEKKITKREVINAMLAEDVVKANADYVAYLENELDLLDKKKNNKKATANQVANIELKAVIVDTLNAVGKGVTASELIGLNSVFAEKNVSLPKMTALLTQLRKEDKVIRTMDKKKALFSVA